MIVGELNRRVKVERPTSTLDGYGAEIKAWVEVGTYWAKVETLSGREAVNAKQIKAEVTHKVTMRYIRSGVPGVPLINPSQRINYFNRVFNILWLVNPDEANVELWVYCQEVVQVA